MNIGIAYQKDFFDKAGATVPDLGVSDSFLGFNCPTDYVITADTKPDCDMPGPDCSWEGKHWVKLHQEKVKKYGKVAADEQWAAAWNSCRGFVNAFGKELSIANNDVAFRNYVIAQGLNKTVPDLKMIAGTAATADAVVATAGSAVDVVTNTAKAAANATEGISNVAKYLPWILVAGVVVFGYFLIKSQTQTA